MKFKEPLIANVASIGTLLAILALMLFAFMAAVRVDEKLEAVGEKDESDRPLRDTSRKAGSIDGIRENGLSEESFSSAPSTQTSPGQQRPALNHIADTSKMVRNITEQALDGVVDLDQCFDLFDLIAHAPVNPIAVENYYDSSVEAYPILVDGVKAFLEIGKDPEEQVTALRIELGDKVFSRGVYRSNSITAYFTHDDQGQLSHFSLQSYSKIALGHNRRQGIEAYRGKYVEGLIFTLDMEKDISRCFLTGINNAKPTAMEGSCTGNLQLDKDRMLLLEARLGQLKKETGR